METGPTSADGADGQLAAKPRRMLTKQGILSKNDQQYEDVPVPEWSDNGDEAFVRVRGLTARERDLFEASIAGSENKLNYDNVRAKMMVRTVIDEQGRLMFTEDDVPILGLKSARALSRVYNVAAKLSGLTKDDVVDLAKNSGRAHSGALSSK